MLMIFAVRGMMMTRQHVVPDDFPRELAPGLLPGAQPKLLAREGRMVHAGLTDEELWTRYDTRQDLSGQLAEYVSRKILCLAYRSTRH
jgi:hypothetical protein